MESVVKGVKRKLLSAGASRAADVALPRVVDVVQTHVQHVQHPVGVDDVAVTTQEHRLAVRLLDQSQQLTQSIVVVVVVSCSRFLSDHRTLPGRGVPPASPGMQVVVVTGRVNSRPCRVYQQTIGDRLRDSVEAAD